GCGSLAEPGRRTDRRHETPQPLRAALQRIALELGNQAVAIVESQLAGFEQTGKLQRKLEYRVEQRRLRRVKVQGLQPVREIADRQRPALDDGGEARGIRRRSGRRWSVRHEAIPPMVIRGLAQPSEWHPCRPAAIPLDESAAILP